MLGAGLLALSRTVVINPGKTRTPDTERNDMRRRRKRNDAMRLYKPADYADKAVRDYLRTQPLPQEKTMIPVQFTCGNCGIDVPFMDAGLRRYEHRNHCPECMWSKHIMFGTDTLKPCDGLMPPVGVTTTAPPFVINECETCGYRWVNYHDDYWATLGPDQQTALINQCYEQTERENQTPTVIYLPKPEYQTEPPRIPAVLLGTRKRVNWRP